MCQDKNNNKTDLFTFLNLSKEHITYHLFTNIFAINLSLITTHQVSISEEKETNINLFMPRWTNIILTSLFFLMSSFNVLHFKFNTMNFYLSRSFTNFSCYWTSIKTNNTQAILILSTNHNYNKNWASGSKNRWKFCGTFTHMKIVTFMQILLLHHVH